MASGRAKPRSRADSADVAAAVDSCQRAQVYIEEPDGAAYIIHVSDDPDPLGSGPARLYTVRSVARAPQRVEGPKIRGAPKGYFQLPRPVLPTAFDKVAEPTDSMEDAHRLALVRGVHTFIYIVMATSTFAVVLRGRDGGGGVVGPGRPGAPRRLVRGVRGDGMKCP